MMRNAILAEHFDILFFFAEKKDVSYEKKRKEMNKFCKGNCVRVKLKIVRNVMQRKFDNRNN